MKKTNKETYKKVYLDATESETKCFEIHNVNANLCTKT